jgi:hypothetical protein
MVNWEGGLAAAIGACLCYHGEAISCLAKIEGRSGDYIKFQRTEAAQRHQTKSCHFIILNVPGPFGTTKSMLAEMSKHHNRVLPLSHVRYTRNQEHPARKATIQGRSTIPNNPFHCQFPSSPSPHSPRSATSIMSSRRSSAGSPSSSPPSPFSSSATLSRSCA